MSTSKRILKSKQFIKQLAWFTKYNPSIAAKINQLILDIIAHPTEGLGKPEPLKYQFGGFWSRRITDKHRLIYNFSKTEITLISCREHYGSTTPPSFHKITDKIFIIHDDAFRKLTDK